MPINLRGISLTVPINRLAAGFVAVCQNIRAYGKGFFQARNFISNAILSIIGGNINTIRRLNDSTPQGPPAGYTYIISDDEGNLFCGSSGTLSPIAIGMTPNQKSMIPFRPNASVQPWMYVFDSSPDSSVTISTRYALSDSSVTFNCSGMVKVRSDGLIYKMGIKEPQVAPTVSTSGSTTSGIDALPATTIPWTNVGGANPTYNYGHTSGGDGTAPVLISTPAGSQTLQLVVTGTATVNRASHSPGDTGATGATFPANFTGVGPTIVLGAFTDGSGNVLTGTSPVPLLANVGAGVTLQVPSGAVNFQIGIDSANNTFSANSGSFSVAWTLVTSAIATKVSTLGDITTYYWGDSPHSGPVATYIWKNPNDTGSGIAKSIGTAVGNVTNNSWQFDSSPEDGTVPFLWDTLDSSGTVTGSIPVFSPKLESEGFQDFNMCVVGSLFIPAAGTYTFTFKFKDQILVGFGAGTASNVTGFHNNTAHNGQTETVVSALPLVFIGGIDGAGGNHTGTVDMSFESSQSVQVEIDYDYWEHTGRVLKMTCDGVVIPPLSNAVRINVVYWGVYRGSQTGAMSNPSPASTPQVTPVLDNTVSLPFSPDPQVDKCDFYRQDNVLANPTYVATGPNTNPPTPIVDSLSDAGAANNPTLQFDNFEPFPSIDTPKKGIVNVSGGNITWVSGDKFNIRWLPGTVIEIGSPTQLAYSLYTRPVSTTAMYLPGVIDGTGLVYNIAEPILAAQPLAFAFGPTDNVNYAYAVQDPLRPGTYYWSKGNNLDSAPDTNQADLTDPGEPLVNGAMTAGVGLLASIKRAWIIEPNYYNALATATGTVGSIFSSQSTEIPRGLYIARAIAVEGGGKVFMRVQDGIIVSIAGGPSKSITDETLYPLFPHENSTPHPVVRNGVTIQPPNDSLPELQQFNIESQWMYWDYQGLDGLSHTLVFDIEAMAWLFDLYNELDSRTLTHASNAGLGVQGVLLGSGSSLHQFTSIVGSALNPTAPQLNLVTGALGGVGFRHFRELTFEYSSTAICTVSFAPADSGNGSYGPLAITLPSTGGTLTKFFTTVSPNKWKLLQMQFTGGINSGLIVNLDGLIMNVKDWGFGGGYQPVQPFGKDVGGEGSE